MVCMKYSIRLCAENDFYMNLSNVLICTLVSIFGLSLNQCMVYLLHKSMKILLKCLKEPLRGFGLLLNNGWLSLGNIHAR